MYFGFGNGLGAIPRGDGARKPEVIGDGAACPGILDFLCRRCAPRLPCLRDRDNTSNMRQLIPAQHGTGHSAIIVDTR
jgi:hypothetical protein